MNSVKKVLSKTLSFNHFFFVFLEGLKSHIGLDIGSPKTIQNICIKSSKLDPNNYGYF